MLSNSAHSKPSVRLVLPVPFSPDSSTTSPDKTTSARLGYPRNACTVMRSSLMKDPLDERLPALLKRRSLENSVNERLELGLKLRPERLEGQLERVGGHAVIVRAGPAGTTPPS